MTEGYRPTSEPGLARTDMHCTECGKNFIAELDYRIDGKHVVECPYCWHEHFRVIKQGLITEGRWGHNGQTIKVHPRSVWKSDVIQARTSTAAQFIRDLWLQRSDLQP